MDLETTLATAAVGATGVVVVEQRPSQGKRGSALPPAEIEVSAVFGSRDHLGVRVAQNCP